MPTTEIMRARPFDEFGPVLTGRAEAAHLRVTLEGAASRGDVVTVDLEGVLTMSPSFADELFAKLDPALVDRIRFEHVAAPIEPLIAFVRRGRSADGALRA